MPDITMCVNVNCPLRERCYRYTAKPSELWQSYAEFHPDRGGESCSSYIEDDGDA